MKNKSRDLIIIAGLPKTGTTTLFESLKNSNFYSVPKIKEPHFFCSDLHKDGDDLTYPVRDIQTYINLFDLEKDTLVDFSTNYFFSKNFPDDINKYSNYFKSIQVYVVLRDIKSWIFSWHRQCILTEGQTEADINKVFFKQSFSKFRPQSYLNYKQRVKFDYYLKNLKSINADLCIYGYSDFWKLKLYKTIFKHSQFDEFLKNHNKGKDVANLKIYYFLKNLFHKLKSINSLFFVLSKLSFIKKYLYIKPLYVQGLSPQIEHECLKNQKNTLKYLKKIKPYVHKSSIKEMQV